MTTADFPDFATPQAHATAIAATGVPLLRGATNLASASAQSLAGGASQTLLNAVPWTQPGWEASFVLNLPAGAGTSPFALVTFTWFDATGAFIIRQKVITLTVGNGPANAITSAGFGPARGELLTVTIKNTDGVATLTYSYTVTQTSHVPNYDWFRQITYAATAPITFVNPSGDPPSGLIAQAAPPVSAMGSVSRLFALAEGKLRAIFTNVGQANQATYTLVAQDQGGIVGTDLVATATVAAGAVDQREFWSPAAPLLYTVNNNGASGSISPNMILTAEEY